MNHRYKIYQSPGWHSQPDDPEIGSTDDEREAAMLAGERIDIHMPGNSNKYDSYAIDAETGERLTPLDSYRCDMCDSLYEWGAGPIGTMDGEILECARAVEKHRVTWVCEACASRTPACDDVNR